MATEGEDLPSSIWETNAGETESESASFRTVTPRANRCSRSLEPENLPSMTVPTVGNPYRLPRLTHISIEFPSVEIIDKGGRWARHVVIEFHYPMKSSQRIPKRY